MTTSDPIFILARSLSQSEKRAFTRFAKLQTPASVNRYLALFQRLAGMKTYNETLLKQEFGARHFEQLKQQLFKKIMQSLRLYHESGEDEDRVALHLHNHRLLKNRDLPAWAEKELKRAAKIAGEATLHQYGQIIFHRQTEATIASKNISMLRERISEHRAFMKKTVEEIVNEAGYLELFIEVDVINEQFEATRNKAELQVIASFLKTPLLRDEQAALTVRAKILFHFIKGLALYLFCDFKSCAAHMGKVIGYFEKNPRMLLQEEKLYVRSVANRSLGLFHCGLFAESKDLLAKLHAIPVRLPLNGEYRNHLACVLELMHLNRQKNFSRAVALIEKNTALFAESGRPGAVSQQRTYNVFQQATAYRGAGNPKKASQIISSFINERGKGMKKDAYIMARILFMLLRFDLNDQSLLESEIRSVQRFLKKENKLFLFEKKMLQFLNAMLTENSTQQIRRNFQKLKKDLLELKKIAYERNAFMYYDFLDWVESFAR
ncbi:MAG: hypothetical protein FD123_3108 [Bacteroidetes bacterium]|nr:MAG: hypothetical protein FD123_3108 [Bacteroidota bacterium]